MFSPPLQVAPPKYAPLSFKAVARATVAAQRLAKQPIIKAHGHKTDLLFSELPKATAAA